MKNAAIVILAILTIMFGIYGFIQSAEAQRQTELAVDHERRALVAEADGMALRDRAAKCEHLSTIAARDLAECQSNKSRK